MKFQNVYDYENKPKNAPTPAGTDFLDTYVEEFDKNGKRVLIKAGQTNVNEKIQANKDTTDTYKILERYNQTGDQSLINKRQGVYMDFRNCANTPIELQNQLMKADKAFETIDKEVRELFNNDINQFKTSILKGEFEQKISKLIKNKKEEPKAEEKTVLKGVNLDE